jgi:serine/threonine-protein kinase RsbW
MLLLYQASRWLAEETPKIMPQLSKKFMSAQQLVSDNVAQAIDWARELGVNDDVAGSIEIVLAEALNNIVEHAYLFAEDGQIEMELSLHNDLLDIQLSDMGNQFPGIPQKREMKGDAIPFEDLPEGGFGWFLIHSLTASIRYVFVGGKNVVHFEINCA